jgi:2-polyprenyl-3-methyl-5-hydroxy-6-metoxy-1,4-benzoquinol methylase
MIAKARAAFGSEAPGRTVRFELANAETLAERERYDLVLCTEVIEHVEHPDLVIANLVSALAPGGIGVVSLPNRCSWPYLLAWAAYRLRNKPRDLNFERHLEYPFHRSLRLFEGENLRRIATDGTNLVWDDRLLRRLYRSPLFPALNRVNFELARIWPLKYLAQFFYVVFRKTDAGAPRGSIPREAPGGPRH